MLPLIEQLVDGFESATGCKPSESRAHRYRSGGVPCPYREGATVRHSRISCYRHGTAIAIPQGIVVTRGISEIMIMRLLSAVKAWVERRRRFRRLFRHDACQLIARDPFTAYYDAQSAAARARFEGNGKAFIYWSKVAAEVARISNAPMDYEIVKSIVDEEEDRARRSPG